MPKGMIKQLLSLKFCTEIYFLDKRILEWYANLRITFKYSGVEYRNGKLFQDYNDTFISEKHKKVIKREKVFV